MNSTSVLGTAGFSAAQVPSALADADPANPVADVGFTERIEKLKSMDDAQLDKMGKEFESIFVSLLLKEMRNTLDTGEGGLFGSEQSDTFGGMFDQFMGEHMAESSPLGIANAIKGYVRNLPIGVGGG